MAKNSALPAKPRSKQFRPDKTRLPDLTPRRLAYREKVARRCGAFIRYFTRASFYGIENFPETGPGLIVTNHLGDADILLGLAGLPLQPDGLGKIELLDLPVFGRWLDRYGVIWVHRGTADRRAIRAALDGLAAGRFVGIAPEGRQSVTGALEEATDGAAYLALKAGVPVIPMTFAGTEDENVYGSFKRLRRPEMSLTIGRPFYLDRHPERAQSLAAGTLQIMRVLASQLPNKYRGFYAGD